MFTLCHLWLDCCCNQKAVASNVNRPKIYITGLKFTNTIINGLIYSHCTHINYYHCNTWVFNTAEVVCSNFTENENVLSFKLTSICPKCPPIVLIYVAYYTTFTVHKYRMFMREIVSKNYFSKVILRPYTISRDQTSRERV